MIRKMQNQKEIPTPKTKTGKNKLTIREHIASRLSSYFPIGPSLSYPGLTKTMKMYLKFKQHKSRLQNIKRIEPQQKYRLGTTRTVIQASYCFARLHKVQRSIVVTSVVRVPGSARSRARHTCGKKCSGI